METAPVCILAGGLGSRLGGAVKDTPKPLLEVAGEPFLIHQLRHPLLMGHTESCCALAIWAAGLKT
jgi:NDP-sugar pyrophosphorylase family protein